MRVNLWDALSIDWHLRPSFFDYGALALTLLGLALAWLQFNKAKTTLQAEIDTKSSLEYNQLLAILPLLQTTLSDVENSVYRDNSYATQRELARFARLCGDVCQLASKLGNSDEQMMNDLQECSTTVALVKEELVINVNTLPREVIKICYSEMSAATQHAEALLTSLRFTTPQAHSSKKTRKA